ncbi:hypothetical protein [Mesorhizobium sp. WSM4312]|uniref:hypothetical protein n=1 Tax=Mesorhizobium sp. WSM4312 TaxID=2029411 RepID=UPI0015C72351|nr:hypothetical protein [Mesorhizobium sp. WSM4312]
MAQNRTGIHRMMEHCDLSYEQIKMCLWVIHLNLPNATDFADQLVQGFRRKNPEWFR